jgi:putative transposase
MARPLRLCLAGGIYHVISRGNAGGPIYCDDLDREHFLAGLDHAVDRYSWLCHAYCLMTTHYHVVLETPLPNLPQGMRQLNGNHASRYNRRHDRRGHVFEARYRSILVEGAQYLLAVCRYVVLNPVRAGMCDRPEEWPWSSYRATAGLAPTPSFLTAGTILGELGESFTDAQAAYREFVAAGVSAALAERIRVNGLEVTRSCASVSASCRRYRRSRGSRSSPSGDRWLRSSGPRPPRWLVPIAPTGTRWARSARTSAATTQR